MIPYKHLTSDRHVPLCVNCPGFVQHDTLYGGYMWRILIPACNDMHNLWREANRTIIAKSGIDFISRMDARDTYHNFDVLHRGTKRFRDERLNDCMLRLSPHNFWFPRDRIAALYHERRFYCDLCHKSVKPEEPKTFEFPEVKHLCHEYRDRSEADRLKERLEQEFKATGQMSQATLSEWSAVSDRSPVLRKDYYYKIVPGKMRRVQSCKHCVRYRLPRERKDALWQQQRAEDRIREKETMAGCKDQIRAIKKFLKEGNPEVLQSLPEGFGPAETSPTSCPPS